MYTKYTCGGFCFHPKAGDGQSGSAEMVIYNPSASTTQAQISVYFTDREAYTPDPIELGPGKSDSLMFPDINPGIFENCGFWGARVTGEQPLLLNVMSGRRINSPNPIFSGGWTSFPGTEIETLWRFPDGLWLDWFQYYQGDVSKSPFPFNEIEDYILLNPNPERVDVEGQILYHRKPPVSFGLTIPGERVLVWNNFDKVSFNENYTVQFRTSLPISASAVRYIYGLMGLQEWGLQVHCAMLGVPGSGLIGER